MSALDARLGRDYEKCVGNPEAPGPLKWRRVRPESGALELSPEAEQAFVETQLDTDIEEGKKRIRERWRLLREARKLLPRAAVRQCSRRTVKGFDVTVCRSKTSGHAFLANLKRCGSVWTCPICAAKITERKRKELQEGLKTWEGLGGKVYLLTLTIPHHCGNATGALCDKLLEAYRKKMQNRAYWRKWTKKIGLKGSVRALEVTYGRNGAHVHIHVLLFCIPVQGGERPRSSDLLPTWISACAAVGLPQPNEHGVDIRDGSYAASYVGKWGLDCELTKSHIKRGRSGGRTPWDLLRASANGDSEAGRLFQEHAGAFFNRRQLVWSKGLRQLLGLQKQKSDKELAEEQTETAVVIAEIGPTDWRRVLRYNAQASVLIVAEKCGSEGLAMFLRNLESQDRHNRSGRIAINVWLN